MRRSSRSAAAGTRCFWRRSCWRTCSWSTSSVPLSASPRSACSAAAPPRSTTCACSSPAPGPRAAAPQAAGRGTRRRSRTRARRRRRRTCLTSRCRCSTAAATPGWTPSCNTCSPVLRPRSCCPPCCSPARPPPARCSGLGAAEASLPLSVPLSLASRIVHQLATTRIHRPYTRATASKYFPNYACGDCYPTVHRPRDAAFLDTGPSIS
mmetsp:Transcript_22857/g.59502  ORF Transcript_22857/g.59502 Transcript_22857/m.59502 type:complete len:209 (-) Transcript_22857:73-699(-)